MKHRSQEELDALKAKLAAHIETEAPFKSAAFDLGISQGCAARLAQGMGYASMLLNGAERQMVRFARMKKKAA